MEEVDAITLEYVPAEHHKQFGIPEADEYAPALHWEHVIMIPEPVEYCPG